MKLTFREKIMLMVLGGIAVIALFYYFLVTPQLDKLVQLGVERQAVRQEVQRVEAQIASMDSIKQQYETLNTRIAEKTTRFFPTILQDKLITVLQDLLDRTAVKAEGANFALLEAVPLETPKTEHEKQSPAGQLVTQYQQLNGNTAGAKTQQEKEPAAQETQQTQETQDAQTGQTAQEAQNTQTQTLAQTQEPLSLDQGLTVTIQFTASYEQLMSFIKSLEALDRTILVKNLSVTKTEDGTLNGTILVDFYALPKITEQDETYFQWSYNDLYGKGDPFN